MRLGGKDKVGYNHFDSYPSELGKTMVNWVRNTPIPVMRDAYHSLLIVSEDDKPTPEQIELGVQAGAFSAEVRYGDVNDFYNLLRNEQGDPQSWITGSRMMIEYSAFLADSLFCEWAYIVNLDDKTLECYKGFNFDPKAAGRYAHLCSDDERKYFGVRLQTAVPIAVIQEAGDAMIEDLLTRLEEDTIVVEEEVHGHV